MSLTVLALWSQMLSCIPTPSSAMPRGFPPLHWPALATAPNPEGDQRTVRVTHAFHPWHGGSSCSWGCGTPGAKTACSSSARTALKSPCQGRGPTPGTSTSLLPWPPGGARLGSWNCWPCASSSTVSVAVARDNHCKSIFAAYVRSIMP